MANATDQVKHRITKMNGRKATCLCGSTLRLPKDMRNRPLKPEQVTDFLLDAYNRHIKF